MPRPGRRHLIAHALQALPPLERLLCHWEDYWLLEKLLMQVENARGGRRPYGYTGAIQNAHRFRDFLIQMGNSPSGLTVSDFAPPIGHEMDGNREALGAMPLIMSTWCFHSRRIYCIDAGLQELLQATSLTGILWSDVEFPFTSFAVQLARPITESEYGLNHDLLIVSLYELAGTQVLDIWLVPTAKVGPLFSDSREDLEQLAERQQWDRLLERLRGPISRLPDYSIRRWYGPKDTLLPKLVSDTLAHWSALATSVANDYYCEHQHLNSIVMRLVAGLPLYLKSLPPGSPHVSPPTKPFRSGLPDRKVITNRWEVCNVTSVIPLTREERVFYGIEGNQEEQRQAKYELSCHFREGHWRRPPGRGDDPTAPRTVHVRPCIVRRDRLPKDGGLPAGTVKSDQDQ